MSADFVRVPRRPRGLVLSHTLLVGCACVLVLALMSATLSTWTDEEYSLASTGQGIAHAYARAVGFERQGPLYFVLLAIWRSIDASVFFARLFSVACIAGFLAVMAPLLRRVWPTAPLFVFAAIAFNPFVVYAGTEIRLYAGALLVSALLVRFFLDGFYDHQRPSARIGFVAAAIAAAYLQYYLMFALVGFGTALLFQRRGQLGAYLGSCTVVALGMIPLLAIVRTQLGIESPSQLGLIASVHIPLGAAADYLLPLHWAKSSLLRFVYAGLAIVALGSVIAARPRIERSAFAMALVASTSIVLVTLVGLVEHVFVIAPRQTVVLFVPLALALAALLATSRKPRFALGFAAAYTIATACSLFSLYGHGAKTGDWSRVGAMLQSNVRPGDAVAIFDADAALPLARYYRGSLVRIPTEPTRNVYSSAAFVIESDAQVEAEIGRTRLGDRRLWLVKNVACAYRNPDYGCAHLERILTRDYRLVSEHTFFESTVTELQPR